MHDSKFYLIEAAAFITTLGECSIMLTVLELLLPKIKIKTINPKYNQKQYFYKILIPLIIIIIGMVVSGIFPNHIISKSLTKINHNALLTAFNIAGPVTLTCIYDDYWNQYVYNKQKEDK